MLTLEVCGLCRGSGLTERLEERDSNGNWHHNTMLQPGLADAWIAADANAPLRWHDVPCPSCDGAGKVVIEHVRCKIF